MASRTLTIEVGNEFIKICDMQRNRNTVMVHNAISVQTPEGTVEDGFVKDINQVSEVIKRALSEEQITSKEVTFVLNSSRVATKEVILPLVKREKIQELVNANASEYFPINIDDYVFSYTILEEKKTKEEQKLRILVFAAPEGIVESYFNLARVLGMKVTAVDYAGNSTLQLIKIQIDERPTLVVQLGMDTTIVSVMNNNILQLQRTIPYGESLLLNSVMESRNVKSNVALELLSSAQIVKDSLDKDDTTASLKYLISNVNRVIEYYSSRNTEAPLQKIIIIGEGADVLGMDVLFANETSLPAERLTLLKNVESYNRIKVSNSLLKQYMANVGASLDPIHLQPKLGGVAVKQKSENTGMYVAFMGICIIASIVLTSIPAISFMTKKSDKEDLQKKINEIADIESVYSEYYKANDKYADLLAFRLSTANSTEWTIKFFEYLEVNMPSDMSIDTLNITNGLANIGATCKTKTEVADLVVKLKECSNVSDVVVTNIEEDYENGKVAFLIDVTYVSDELISIEKLTEEAE